MDNEMLALYQPDAWVCIPGFPSNNSVAGCHWVHIVKIHPYDIFYKLKASLVAKGYNQVDGHNF